MKQQLRGDVMKEETISELPEVFRNCISTLKRTSRDDSKKQTMCESTIKVINFDKIPNQYSKNKGFRNVPKSNDALYIEDKKWCFIEFKNGEVDKANIYQKIYDSLIMLLEMEVIPDLNFARQNIEYILVYNSDKYPKVQKSQGRDQNYSYFFQLAKQEEKLFGVEKFEGYLLKETHTYTKEMFQKQFVEVIEKEELK